ncbi:hypothetical protein AAFF_G00011340 [Aldrovandia affinis]|uniref:Uncharacterized protein n=1 Tax=Aldrovandia affinis TaxID=143900 RepID=A0AAD7WHR4_9TELE|nr:hypothetical protein AAFF_G00011340 [Aldrovandia affinis]
MFQLRSPSLSSFPFTHPSSLSFRQLLCQIDFGPGPVFGTRCWWRTGHPLASRIWAAIDWSLSSHLIPQEL